MLIEPISVESSSVTSTRRARIYGIGVDQKYQPEAQASAYPDPSMIVLNVKDERSRSRFGLVKIAASPR